jgi:hypothetical protein
MVLYIKHRVNKISDIKNVNLDHGAELDIRSDINNKQKLVVTHDAWDSYENLDDWLSVWKKHGATGPLIFNTKEDGLEEQILKQAEKHDIKNYFFLDTALPTLVKWSIVNNNSNFVLRYSQFENIDISFVNKVQWLWIDCFFGYKPPLGKLKDLKNLFKLCLVSPELQGFQMDKDWLVYKEIVHAVCTKTPEKWI